jgi:hypothetical protein
MMQINEGIGIYQVGCFVALPMYLVALCNFVTIKNNVTIIQMRILQLNWIFSL